jgi:hypothetical protein
MRLFLLAILLLLALTNSISIKHLEGEVADADATTGDAGDDSTDDGLLVGGDDTISPDSLPDAKDLTREQLEQFYSIVFESINNGPPS